LLDLPPAAKQFERCYGQLEKSPEKTARPDLNILGALLELAFGLSAWKSRRRNRWALRCNPSSGNLHLVEVYVLAGSIPGLGDGLHHYDPENHALEGRALAGLVGQVLYLDLHFAHGSESPLAALFEWFELLLPEPVRWLFS
jgi:hypothetical protein